MNSCCPVFVRRSSNLFVHGLYTIYFITEISEIMICKNKNVAKILKASSVLNIITYVGSSGLK
jgi:hypothetical protein